jgi:hypothetical protein
MPIKIGFVNFTGLDAPAATEYAAYKKLQRVLEPYGQVKSLAETHPPMPPWRFEPPALNRTPDTRLYKLAAELAPLMDQFHHRILDRSRLRAQLDMIERTRFQNDMAEIKYYRQVDRLHAWITELLFERVYRRVGRNIQMFEKAALRDWLDARHWKEVHQEQRLAESKLYPELHKKELVHPYRFEIKLPNDEKALDKAQEHNRDERRIIQDARIHAHHLRQVLHDIIFDEVKQELSRQYVARRDHYEQKARWHLHDVMRAFEKAWMHAWDSRDAFRELVRRGIFEQAEIYPKLFRKALVDPWEVEIREPNEKDHHQKIQAHIDQERQELALIKLESEAGRQVLKNIKTELAAYHLVSADKMEAHRLNSQWQKHVLVERSDQQDLEQRDHISDAKRVESQGYQLLAGRMIPQPRFGVDADIVTRVPLTMGLHGDPRAPEHITPTPLLLAPAEQKKNWQEARTIREEEERSMLADSTEGWHKKTRGILQNLAALDYAEQSTREIQRPDPQVLGDAPVKENAVSASCPPEPISEIKLLVPPEEFKTDGKITKKKDEK